MFFSCVNVVELADSTKFRWSVPPDYGIALNRRLHLFSNVRKVHRKISTRNPNRLTLGTFDCVDQKFRNTVTYPSSGIDQLNVAEAFKFRNGGCEYCGVSDFSTGILCSQLIRVVDKYAFQYGMHVCAGRILMVSHVTLQWIMWRDRIAQKWLSPVWAVTCNASGGHDT
jgi:hypothetical protein